MPTILRSGDRRYRVTVARGGAVSIENHGEVIARQQRDGAILLPHGGAAWAAASGDTRWVFLDGNVYEFEVQRAGGGRRAGGHRESLAAPMPATVLRIQVSAGSLVKRGDTLMVLEAMKMELPVRAPADGLVTAVKCREGELVQPGTSLIELDE